jgi:hypothetical protein
VLNDVPEGGLRVVLEIPFSRSGVEVATRMMSVESQ